MVINFINALTDVLSDKLDRILPQNLGSHVQGFFGLSEICPFRKLQKMIVVGLSQCAVEPKSVVNAFQKR